MPVKKAKKAAKAPIPAPGRKVAGVPTKDKGEAAANTRDRMALRIQLFVEHYVTSFNATQAALAAGYSAKGAAAEGSNLLKDGRVQERLQQAALSSVSRAEIRSADILQALSELAYSDPAELFQRHPDNSMTAMELAAMPRHVRRAIKEFKIVKRNLTAGDGQTDLVVDVKFWPKNDALNQLMQHRGLLKTVIEHHVTHATLEKLPDVELARAHREELEKYERHLAARDRMRSGLTRLPAANTEEEE